VLTSRVDTKPIDDFSDADALKGPKLPPALADASMRASALVPRSSRAAERASM
jgi:hypothetical protein